MRNTKREIEFLQRLHQLTPTYEELMQFLNDERLIGKEELKVVRNSPERAKLLQHKLAILDKDGKLQLLQYEWTLLPVERMKLTLITDSVHKEFDAEV